MLSLALALMLSSATSDGLRATAQRLETEGRTAQSLDAAYASLMLSEAVNPLFEQGLISVAARQANASELLDWYLFTAARTPERTGLFAFAHLKRGAALLFEGHDAAAEREWGQAITEAKAAAGSADQAFATRTGAEAALQLERLRYAEFARIRITAPFDRTQGLNLHAKRRVFNAIGAAREVVRGFGTTGPTWLEAQLILADACMDFADLADGDSHSFVYQLIDFAEPIYREVAATPDVLNLSAITHARLALRWFDREMSKARLSPSRETTRAKATAAFQAQEYSRAAAGYLELATLSTEADQLEEALKGAAHSFEAMKRFDEARDVWRLIIRFCAASKAAASAEYEIGKSNEKSSDLRGALSHYCAALSKEPAGREHDATTYAVTRLLPWAGRMPCDIGLERSAPIPMNALSDTAVLEAAAEWPDGEQLLDVYIEAFAADAQRLGFVARARRQKGLRLQARGATDEALAEWKLGADALEGASKVPALEAELRLLTARVLLERFEAIAWRTKPDAAFQKSFREKREAMKPLLATCARLIELNEPEPLLEAHWLLGQAWEHWATSIQATKRPGLDDIGLSPRERAMDEYAALRTWANEHVGYDVWVERADNALKWLRLR